MPDRRAHPAHLVPISDRELSILTSYEPATAAIKFFDDTKSATVYYRGQIQEDMKKLLLALLAATPLTAYTQPLTGITNIRIYEHHSSSINGGQVFGMSANGTLSGYDFVNNTYYPSINPADNSPWTSAEQANIDLVEHNGPFGNLGPFGFTSGISTIWGGDIKGNGTTRYMPAPANFHYDTITNVASIRNAYNANMATAAINTVDSGKVYLARIRNTDQYVAMKITRVVNEPPGAGPTDTLSVYFDFDYKYGIYVATSVDDAAGTAESINIYPNPSGNSFRLRGIPASMDNDHLYVRVASTTGQVVLEQVYTGMVSHNLPPGLYIIIVSDGKKELRTRLSVH